MNVLVLGGTGSIGSAIVQQLQLSGHKVFALARSAQAIAALKRAGAVPVSGDLTEPASWIHTCDRVDGVIHAAAVWGDSMGQIDKLVVNAILNRLQLADTPRAFIYTGGCWLYGQTGNLVATEQTAFNPPASFSWAIPTIEKILNAKNVRAMVIHPAMVYERNGGVFEHIVCDAAQLGYVRIIGNENIRWPLVHKSDLAQAYVLMLEQGLLGDVYNIATNHGVTIGEITRAVAGRLGVRTEPILCDVKTAIDEIGSWAEGYIIDQQMSGSKARLQLGWQPQIENVFAEIS